MKSTLVIDAYDPGHKSFIYLPKDDCDIMILSTALASGSLSRYGRMHVPIPPDPSSVIKSNKRYKPRILPKRSRESRSVPANVEFSPSKPNFIILRLLGLTRQRMTDLAGSSPRPTHLNTYWSSFQIS